MLQTLTMSMNTRKIRIARVLSIFMFLITTAVLSYAQSYETITPVTPGHDHVTRAVYSFIHWLTRYLMPAAGLVLICVGIFQTKSGKGGMVTFVCAGMCFGVWSIAQLAAGFWR